MAYPQAHERQHPSRDAAVTNTLTDPRPSLTRSDTFISRTFYPSLQGCRQAGVWRVAAEVEGGGRPVRFEAPLGPENALSSPSTHQFDRCQAGFGRGGCKTSDDWPMMRRKRQVMLRSTPKWGKLQAHLLATLQACSSKNGHKGQKEVGKYCQIAARRRRRRSMAAMPMLGGASGCEA